MVHCRTEESKSPSTSSELFLQTTPGSRALHERALELLPGGDTRTVTYFPPYPIFMKAGSGCWLTDVDDNKYLDLVNNYTSLIHGHAHPETVLAMARRATAGWCFAAPNNEQIELAEILSKRLTTLERVRFCNSGTEATLAAMRVAKAFTGRNKIVKMEGGYHGSHDAAEVSVNPPLDEAGPLESPRSRAECHGLFCGVLDDVVVVPFNDIENTRRVLSRHSTDIAGVIVEPIMGAAGTVPATSEFLNFLRSATTQCGALLIFDEIISFRLGYGGGQAIAGVRPDLTTLGKIIGGGLPVGAFGGRADLMSLFDPRRNGLSHSGTFNGNALTLAAGIATLGCLTAQEITRINELGELLRQGLRHCFSSNGVGVKVTGSGSLAAWHFTESEVTSYRDVERANRALNRPLHMALLTRGVFTMPRGSVCISTPMGKREIDHVLSAFNDAIREMCNIGLFGSV